MGVNIVRECDRCRFQDTIPLPEEGITREFAVIPANWLLVNVMGGKKLLCPDCGGKWLALERDNNQAREQSIRRFFVTG
jgi:hypothetical protein